MEHSVRNPRKTVDSDAGDMPTPDAGERLWCVHVEGLDDFIATVSMDAAEREAAAINVYVDGCRSSELAAVRAVAIEWPFTPASHARALEADWDDIQRMAHKRAAVSEGVHGNGVLAVLSRFMKVLVRPRDN